MLQPVKYLHLLLTAYILLAAGNAPAQYNNDLARKYSAYISNRGIAISPSTSERNFYLIVSRQESSFKVSKNPFFKIERQLDDSAFIISLNSDEKMITDKKDLWIAPANCNWKLSPPLLNGFFNHKLKFPGTYLTSTKKAGSIKTWTAGKKMTAVSTTVPGDLVITVTNYKDLGELVQQDAVDYIGIYNIHPQNELQVNDLDLSANKINKVHNEFPLLNGNGMVLSIKENLPDTTDIDIMGRYISNPLSAPAINPHSTIMATMAAGAGNSWYTGRGVADGAAYTSSDFMNLLPDPGSNYQQYNISVQNHSYGVGIENFYGADAAAYDAAALSNDKLLFVFSAGNSGTITPADGPYAGISTASNLTGSFKMAKNIITVGATDSFAFVAAQSSKGPAYDGRVKPEMVAYGLDGSSGAAALVSGTCILLQQAYKNNNNGNLPPSSLVKATLLNSADEIDQLPLSYHAGYGSLDAEKAVQDITAQQYFTGAVANAATQNFSVSIPANTRRAKFTLVWNDAAAAPNAFKALVNDLDLEIHDNSTTTWKPWVLNSAANIDSLTLPPVRKRDTLNNIEQVTIDSPTAGSYNILVKGFGVSSGSQAFSVAYDFEVASSFNWDLPTAGDNIFPGMENVIRWRQNISSSGAQLSYSIDGGVNWQTITNNVDPAAGYFRWNAPDTNALAILKMQVGSQSFLSDTFTITQRPFFNVGFNCTDSVLWYWNKLKGVSNYQLFGLGNKYLEPVTVIADTQFIFNKNSLLYKWFAVAPVINSKPGIKSYTTDYSTQGTACYFTNFTADLVDGHSAFIQLTIGTVYLVKKISIEKISGNNFSPIKDFDPAGLYYSFTDNSLSQGVNNYRARIELQDGRIFYSLTVSVFLFVNSDVAIYPNPVAQNTNLQLLFKDLQNQQVRIYDVEGRLMYEQNSSSTQMAIRAIYPAGIYFLSIFNPETNEKRILKLVIY